MRNIPARILDKNILYLNRHDLTGLLEDVTKRGLSFRFKANGFSMIPFIRDGDVVVVSPLSERMNLFGRAVAVIHPGTKNLAVHRVVGVSGGGYIIKGDNVFNVDGVVPKSDVLGYVSKVERKSRNVLTGLGFERFLIVALSRVNAINISIRYAKKLFFPQRKQGNN